MSNHAKPFDFHQTDGGSNLSFRERLVLCCKKYLRELEAGTSTGKPTALASAQISLAEFFMKGLV